MLDDLESVFDSLAFVFLFQDETPHVVVIFQKLSVPFSLEDLDLVVQLN